MTLIDMIKEYGRFMEIYGVSQEGLQDEVPVKRKADELLKEIEEEIKKLEKE